jgi:hypothetical protein
MPPLNDANLAVQSPIALKHTPDDGNHANGSVSGVDLQALVQSVTESVVRVIAEKYTLAPRK